MLLVFELNKNTVIDKVKGLTEIKKDYSCRGTISVGVNKPIMRHTDQGMCSRRFGNSSKFSRVNSLQYSRFNVFLNNVIFSEF